MKQQIYARLPAFLALVFFGSLWGATLPLVKVAVSGGHQPMGLTFWELVFSVIILTAVALARGYKLPLGRQYLVYYSVIGIVGTLIPNVFSYLAIIHLPAGIMAIVLATTPMCTMMIALGLGNEKFRWLRLFGLVLGIVAMGLLVLPQSSLPEPGKAIFLLVGVVAPVCYAIEGNYVGMRAPKDLNSVSVLLGASIIGAILAGPMAWVSGQWVDLLVPWGKPEWALLGFALAHVIAYAGYLWLISYSGVVFSAQMGYVVTMSGFFFSMLFLGEAYSGYVWLALTILIVGLTLVQPLGPPQHAGRKAKATR